MKKFLLSILVVTLSLGVEAQVVPLKVFNGTAQTLIVHSVAVLGVSPACGPGGTSAAVGIVVAPGATITIAPLLPGNSTVDWGAVKITNTTYTAGIGAVHPYFYSCFGIGGPWGTPVFTDYWYAIGSTPFQLVKIY